MDLGHTEWRKSSLSGGGGELDDEECVEIAFAPGRVGVRDSKNVAGGALVVTEGAWRSALRSLLS
ncbi:hypothetical protein [Alloactinosynnema sp. L-07]|uniref:DUF397 domain-containing protein n=1 Tax=Alloactinosynnema sp. L-07 TaxID=1653480 RepID=UPI00065F03A5|nr:DUF397 domain-containing protein [Alloactinosynnema sp. L-07]CRK61570.1 hypothetical protein [Alloactinosynnema sp. L-07]